MCYHSEKSKFRASKCVKLPDFALLESPKLISRKIRVIEKIEKFPHCNVLQLLYVTVYITSCLFTIRREHYLPQVLRSPILQLPYFRNAPKFDFACLPYFRNAPKFDFSCLPYFRNAPKSDFT